MALPPLVLRIYADSTGLKAGLRQSVVATKTAGAAMTQQYQGFGKKMKTVDAGVIKGQSGIRNALAANAGAIKGSLAVAAVIFAVKSTQSFLKAQDVIAQTNAVLKSTKGIAGVTGREVAGLAKEMANLTTFSDEEVASAENLLLTFTNIKDNIFPQTTQAVLDMSQSLGQDLKTSSIQLGKALNDPILGLTSLSRVGVKFTQETRDQIKALVENGHVMKAQKIILAELATEFGGSAKAAAKTFGGQLKQVGNQFGEVMEQVGALIAQLAPVLIPAIKFTIRVLSNAITTLTKMVNGIKIAVVWVGQKFVAAWNAIKGPVLAVIDAITSAVMILVNGIKGAVSWIAKLGSASVPTINGRPATDIGGVRGQAFGRQHGGPVSAMRPYIVGERGPELFVPKMAGRIEPNGDSAGLTIHVHGDVNDAAIFQRKVVTAVRLAVAGSGAR